MPSTQKNKKRKYFKALAFCLVLGLLNIQLNAHPLGNSISVQSSMDGLDKVEAEIYDAFTDIEPLLELLQNTSLSFEEIAVLYPEMLSTVDDSASLPTQNDSGKTDHPLGIPAFLWGCVFGLLGIILVYIVTDSQDKAKEAVKGCALAYGTIAVVYVVFVAIAISTSEAAATTY